VARRRINLGQENLGGGVRSPQDQPPPIRGNTQSTDWSRALGELPRSALGLSGSLVNSKRPDSEVKTFPGWIFSIGIKQATVNRPAEFG